MSKSAKVVLVSVSGSSLVTSARQQVGGILARTSSRASATFCAAIIMGRCVWLFERAGQATGFDMKIHPHMLRHACGFKLANSPPSHSQFGPSGIVAQWS